MIRFLSHIKFLTIALILIGFALASVHHHDGIMHSGEIIVEIGDPECSMCDGIVKIGSESLTLSSPYFNPISTVPVGMVMTVNLPFERIIKDRAPPSRA